MANSTEYDAQREACTYARLCITISQKVFVSTEMAAMCCVSTFKWRLEELVVNAFVKSTEAEMMPIMFTMTKGNAKNCSGEGSAIWRFGVLLFDC
jgi:hypothetical protein